MRKYDVNEIDQMRSDIATYHAFTRDGSNQNVEDELRTYLVAGTPPDELKARAEKAKDDLKKRSAEKDAAAKAQRDRFNEISRVVEYALNERGVFGINRARPPSSCADANTAAVVRYADAQKRSNAFMRALFGP